MSPRLPKMLTDWKFEDIHIRGFSQAGTGSCYLIPQLKLVMDTAQGLPFTYNCKFLFLTHGHIDHAGGVAYILSQRGLMGLGELPIYLPVELQGPLDQILKTWQAIEGFQYKYSLIPLTHGQEVGLTSEYSVKALKTKHRVPSLGYCIFKSHKKLKLKYADVSQKEIIDLKRQGVEVDEMIKLPWLAYSGDSEINFLNYTEVSTAKVLILECTYIDDKRSVEHAKEWGHIHVNELLPRVDLLENKKILLTHISARYTEKDIENQFKKIFTPEQKERVEFFR